MKQLTTLEINVIDKMCECNMNESMVGRELYLHRNTVTYHILKIKEKTGFDTRRFYDLVKLRKLLDGEV